jgi:hypothetical protein
MTDTTFDEVERMIGQIGRAFADAMKPALAKINAMGDAIIDACGGWEAFQKMVADLDRWRVEHPFVEPNEPCACLCRAHGHDLGTCTVWAEEIHTIHSSTFGPVVVPVCSPCAVAIRRFAEGTDGKAESPAHVNR